MNKNKGTKAPSWQEKLTIRLMILIGILSFANFFYWFLRPDLIEVKILFWILVATIAYDTLRVIYIWYHYWDISTPKKPVSTRSYTVDVFTTYFPGEPYEMIKETLLAIQRIRYPHTTYLCDEANDQHLKEFCIENNIQHVTRNNRIDAKAGNINNALKQANGEICVILDPDHVPRENFIEELVPYFENEKIGFVQTIQAYYNVDESLVAKGAAEQTFHFYGPVMMSMNSYGTVNAIGANCVFRRKALDSIGGHAAGLSEDMHTAMQLHAKGWQSVYVPNVFTKGLVPASLTAYYKQQLKWSRGTLELLVAVYPKLFRKFTWRQKIHYGVLPFHYLSGIISLISFLIPIISLFTAALPWKGNIINFGLIFLPVLVSMASLRFYIQKWLMYPSERGFHFIGGLLQTCTWWIYIIGFVYTIIRKKVPYLPTPKEDKESTSWKILVPNLFIGVVSIAAVFYGLSIDYTPFSILMAGFALLNALFMFYTLYFAYEKQKPVVLDFESEILNTASIRLQNFTLQFWRKAALPILVFTFIYSFTTLRDIEYDKWLGVTPEPKDKNFVSYLGIFAPQNDLGFTDLRNVKSISKEINENFDIISLYLAWNKNSGSFPQSILDSIYLQKSIPMITWEPWLNTFKNEIDTNKHVYDLIEEGFFDSFITDFAYKLKKFERPIFLRFAHEFDNPFYPWFLSGPNASAKFKKAWIHTYNIFKSSGATNVVWIWNPWKSQNIEEFYPGEEYVDWFGVNILNYGIHNPDGEWHEFRDLYEPFRSEFKNLPATPVIISEFGAINDDFRQTQWIDNAFYDIENELSEVISVIYFNSKVDKNWPSGYNYFENLDWTISKSSKIKSYFSNKQVPEYVFNSLQGLESENPDLLKDNSHSLKNIRGINIKKGHDWRKDYHVYNRNKLENDFDKIKDLGINTLKFEGNTVYDRNLLNLAKENKLFVSYGFWVPADLDFVKDTVKTELLKRNILKLVKRYKNNSSINSWNIQNDVQYNQKDFFLKPRLLYQNNAYILWMKSLIAEVKKIDPSRPIIVDLEANLQALNHVKTLINNVNGIDAIGLVVKEDKYLSRLINYLNQANISYIFSEIRVKSMEKWKFAESQVPFFITSWQDQHESNKLTFDGLIDRKGRFKPDFFSLLELQRNSDSIVNAPKVKILKPATPIFDNALLSYYAICYDPSNGWMFGEKIKGLQFEWALIKCDIFGNCLAVKDIGSGDRLKLKIPKDHQYFKLLLTTFDGKSYSTNITTLNTPLIQK